MSPRAKGLLIAFIGTTFWATTGIFMDYLLIHYPIQPLTLAFWRDLMVGLALLIGLGLWRPQALRLTWQDVGFFMIYGFVGLAVFNGLWSFSVKFNGAAIATVLAYSSPMFTLVLGRLILRESLTGRKVVAVGLSLIGCALVVEAHKPEVWQVNALGIAVGLGTGVAFACYNLGGRWSATRFPNPLTVTAYGFAFAAAGLLLTQTPDTLFSLGTAWDGWAIIAVLSLVPTIIGYGLYTLSLRFLQASMASLLAATEPVITALMAIVVLGKWMSAVQWAGALLILFAVILAQTGAKATQETEVVTATVDPAYTAQPET